jgi:hypothetical protein
VTRGNSSYVEGDLRNISDQSVTNVQIKGRVFDYTTGQSLAVLTGTTAFAAVLPGQLMYYNLGPVTITATQSYTAQVEIVSFEVTQTQQLTLSAHILQTGPLRIVLQNNTPYRLVNVGAWIWAAGESQLQFYIPFPLPVPWDGTLTPGESITLPVYDDGNGCCIDYADIRVAAQGTISPTSSGP